jgi:glycosyltransferase involved in cell wall biosynthesis
MKKSEPRSHRIPKVSVCVITYNHENYIAECLTSIVNQKTAFDFEVIIGEDSSADKTRKICESFQRNYNAVHLLEAGPNLGSTRNLIRTLASCRGDYIAVCEGDDYWLDPRKLYEQVKILDSNPTLAGAAHQTICVKAGADSRLFKVNVKDLNDTEDLIAGRKFHTASLCFRRQVLTQFLQAPNVYSADRMLYLCISLYGRIYYDSRPMCVYRIHQNGASSNASTNALARDFESIAFLKALKKNFPESKYALYLNICIALCRKGNLRRKISALLQISMGLVKHPIFMISLTLSHLREKLAPKMYREV